MAELSAWDVLPVITMDELAHIDRAISARSEGTWPPRPCMFCGYAATFAVAALELAPPRWLDVCGAGGQYLRSGDRLCTGRLVRHG